MYIHVVKQTETLAMIAEQYGINIERLCLDNGILSSDQLQPGQALLILEPELKHTVTTGETLSSIAQNYQTSILSIIRNNPFLRINSPLSPNQSLIISYATDKRGGILTNGYIYPYIDNEQLNNVLPYLSMITPFTFGFREDGSLIEIDTADIVEASLSIGTNAVFLLSTLEDNNRFNSYLPGKVFANPDTKQALITNVINAAIKGKFRYIDIDFEFLPKEEAENFAAFIKDLRDQANTNGIFVIVALAPKTYAEQPGLLYEGHPYRLLGESADYVLLMTYEWGYTYGPAQAVAPINKVRQVVEYATREIDHNKILLGFPNYGYDWPLPYQSGNMAKSIGNIEAIALARRYNQRILYDSVAQTPYFYYTDSNGTQHAVWFEDARSALAKLNLISEFDLAGLSVWTAMRPFPPLWQLTNVLFDVET